MNRLLSGFILLNIGLVGGYFAQPFVQVQLQTAGLISSTAEALNGSSSEPKILYWVAPMDANYRREKPGKSPMGMDLVAVYEEEGGEEGVVKISPVVQNNLGVRIDKVKKGKLDREINTVGYISFDEEKLFHFHTRVEGWVEKLVVKATGDLVKKGQKLFELYSPALVNAQEEYLTALKSKNGILITASKGRLTALGISKRHINRLDKTRKIRQRISYFSNNDGFIENLKIREGMFIKPSMDVLTIGQIDTVWVIAEVFERQSGWVEKGQSVNMTVTAYPNKSWKGTIDYIYPVLDKNTRTLRVRIRFDNKEGLLKPNMFSRLTIHSSFNTETLFVKREAIIRNGRMERVVKALGDGKFKSVEIITGSENSDYIEVIKGLDENDDIVTSAQFLIDSESSLTASFERMQEPKSNKIDVMAMDNMASIMSKKEPAKIKHNQAWVQGQVLVVKANESKLSIQHEPVKIWGWPQMKMDFPVAKSVNIKIFDANEQYNFLVEKQTSGSIEIVDFNKKVKP